MLVELVEIKIAQFVVADLAAKDVVNSYQDLVGHCHNCLTHPGVGPVTALATEVFLGNPERFADSKALASYVGMIPREYSSGKRQRLGGFVRRDPEL